MGAERDLTMANDVAFADQIAELVQLGVALFDDGKLDAAHEIFATLHSVTKTDAEVNRRLGLIHCLKSDYAGAIARLEDAVVLGAADPLTLNALSVCYFERGAYEKALEWADRSAAAEPAFQEAHNSRGNALERLGRNREAADALELAIELNPHDPIARINLANALRGLGRGEEAVGVLEAAIAIAPQIPEAHVNRGNVLQDLRRHAEALQAYDRALALDPNSVDARWNRCLCRLLTKDFAGGWPEYEWRWRRDAAESRPRGFQTPLWLGQEPLAGRTILLHGEQGQGDCIQFARYVRDVAALGPKVVLEVYGSLIELFGSLEGVDQLVARGSPLPATDFQTPLMSLPLALGHTGGPPAIERPYLQTPADRRAAWAAALGSHEGIRIGLVCSGSPTHKGDARRSLPLEQLLEAMPDGAELHLLQKEVAPRDRETLAARPEIRVWRDRLGDFADTAALAEEMDLVVSVDTSVAHLAGALGRPTTVLIPYDPDWRWGLTDEVSAWYPSVRIFRQARRDDWSDPLGRLAQGLAGHARH